eukprot:PhM_4_TR1997/c0_g1_i1/m.9005
MSSVKSTPVDESQQQQQQQQQTPALTLAEFLNGAMGFNPNEDATPKDKRDDMFIKGYPRTSFDADGLTPIRVALPPVSSHHTMLAVLSDDNMCTIRRIAPVHFIKFDVLCHRATAYVATPCESECRTLLTTVITAMVLRHENTASAFAFLSSELKGKKNKYVGHAVVSSAVALSAAEIESHNHVVTVGTGEEMYFVGSPSNVHMARAEKLFLSMGSTAQVRDEICTSLLNEVDPTGSVSLEVLDIPEMLKGLLMGKKAAKKRHIESCTGAWLWLPPCGGSYVFGGEEEREYVKFYVLAMKKFHADRLAPAKPCAVDAAKAMASTLMRTSSIRVPSVSFAMMCGAGRSALTDLECAFNVLLLEAVLGGEEEKERAVSGHLAKGLFVMGSSLGRWRAGMSILRRLSVSHTTTSSSQHNHYAALIRKLTTTSVGSDHEGNGFGAELSHVGYLKHFLIHGRHLVSRYVLAADVAAEFTSEAQVIIVGRAAHRGLFKWLVSHRNNAVNKDSSDRNSIMTTVVSIADIALQEFITTFIWAAPPIRTASVFADIESPVFKEIDKVQTETNTCFVLVGDSVNGPFLGFGVVGVSPYAREHAAARIAEILSDRSRASRCNRSRSGARRSSKRDRESEHHDRRRKHR